MNDDTPVHPIFPRDTRASRWVLGLVMAAPLVFVAIGAVVPKAPPRAHGTSLDEVRFRTEPSATPR